MEGRATGTERHTHTHRHTDRHTDTVVQLNHPQLIPQLSVRSHMILSHSPLKLWLHLNLHPSCWASFSKAQVSNNKLLWSLHTCDLPFATQSMETGEISSSIQMNDTKRFSQLNDSRTVLAWTPIHNNTQTHRQTHRHRHTDTQSWDRKTEMWRERGTSTGKKEERKSKWQSDREKGT